MNECLTLNLTGREQKDDGQQFHDGIFLIR